MNEWAQFPRFLQDQHISQNKAHFRLAPQIEVSPALILPQGTKSYFQKVIFLRKSRSDILEGALKAREAVSSVSSPPNTLQMQLEQNSDHVWSSRPEVVRKPEAGQGRIKGFHRPHVVPGLSKAKKP